MDRRTFLKATAAATGAAALMPFRTGYAASDEERKVLEAWTTSLRERGERRVFRAKELNEIAMPMGGIGAGQVYLTGKGLLDRWQIMNNFNSGAHAPGAFFGVWAREQNKAAVARLLQQGDMDGIPGMPSVTFSGEYPFAWIEYENVDTGLPVQVSLESFSPMIPLNAQDSGLPAVVFRFTLRNTSEAPVEASLLASQPNLVGWDGYAPLEGMAFEEFIANENVAEGSCIELRTVPGKQHRLSAACGLATNDESIARAMRQCENLTVHFDKGLAKLEGKDISLFWLGDLREGLAEVPVVTVLERVSKGASVVLAGLEQAPLLFASDPKHVKGRRRTFETWEGGDYDGWHLEGGALGEAPAEGTLPGQKKVKGYHGRHLVNTFLKGDVSTGRGLSKGFKIKHDYIHVLVGGGKHEGETCVNLLVGGKAVFSATGRDSEQLQFSTWDVRAYRKKTAHIEIVDEATGGWGHVLVDDIVFSNSPIPPGMATKASAQLYDAAPFTWSSSKVVDKAAGLASGGALSPTLDGQNVTVPRYRVFDGLTLRPGAEVLLKAEDGTPLLVKGRYGEGRVFVCNGNPKEWAGTAGLGALLASILGAEYGARTGWPQDAPQYGGMALGSDMDKPSVRAQWDRLEELWQDFAQDGLLTASDAGPSPAGRTWNAAMCTPLTLAPGQSKTVSFVLAWHFPNRVRTEQYGWGPGPFQYDHRLGNQYTNLYASAREVAQYVLDNLERLTADTRLFHDTFYDSTLPHWFLDCVSANMSIVRSPIYVWLEDGTLGGFEGSDACCPMNCTHVYNYAMVMPYLYPDLERNVREGDIRLQMNPERHFIPHRTALPMSLPRLGDAIGGPEHHALDGELGELLKTYREWRMYGDKEWLATLWPNLRLVLEHVWKEHDVDGDGVIKGEQPNTYDTHLYGSNTFIGTLYLAALRAMEELAAVMDDDTVIKQCRARFEAGRAGYDQLCWNGEYYINLFNAPGAKAETYNENNCYGPGCHSDQLLGQWWAHLLGLGYVLPQDHVRDALKAIHSYNWRLNFEGHLQQPRRFANDDEKGLLCCSWPKGGRPEKPILYGDEIWTGIEYQVAATMIYEGMVDEAFQIIRGARDRYTGEERNPWSEIECGGHYARAMSSWSLLHAAAGFEYDAGKQSLLFDPRVSPGNYQGFFTAGDAWGTLLMCADGPKRRVRISVKQGEFSLRHLYLSPKEKTEVKITGSPRVRVDDGVRYLSLFFKDAYRLTPDRPLELTY